MFNTEQGRQFISSILTLILQEHHPRISMDGHVGWRYNIYIERFWRTVYFEEIFLIDIKTFDS